MSSEHPRVFVSHATEDKNHFVEKFATKLRSQGIEAWYDSWEIKPGDSLVNKIFDDGIGKAEAIIVVLSKVSVDKPWVKKELDTGVVKQITQKIKLIPVVIDDCTVPESLIDTKYLRINDVQNYESEFQEIVNVIYGHSTKPPLGAPPSYTQIKTNQVYGLEQRDIVVLKFLYEYSIEIDNEFFPAPDIISRMKEIDINEDTYYDCLEILNDYNYIEGDKVQDDTNKIFLIHTNSTGFEEYGRLTFPEFEKFKQTVLKTIINQNFSDHVTIATSLKQPPKTIWYILNILTSNGYIETYQAIGGPLNISEVTPRGKRKANE